MEYKFRVYCIECGWLNMDMSRLLITKQPDEAGGELRINFFCVNCGHENNLIVSKGSRFYSQLLALWDGR